MDVVSKSNATQSQVENVIDIETFVVVDCFECALKFCITSILKKEN